MITKTPNLLSLFVFLLLLLQNFSVEGQQTVRLDSCISQSRRNYPLIAQKDLIKKSEQFSIENLNTDYLPQLLVSGQATYQSAVTGLPFTLPNLGITPLSKDQYRLSGEVVQPISDLFYIEKQKELVSLNAGIEDNKVEAELLKLKDRVIQLFFGILLIDAQTNQVKLLKKELDAAYAKTKANVESGIMIQSSLLQLETEIIKADQKMIELNLNKKATLEILSALTGVKYDAATILESPKKILPYYELKRPELNIFQLQEKSTALQQKLLSKKIIPRFSAFFQGGYGRPTLNMLSNDFGGYYITGFRLNWNLSGFYTFGRDRKILSLNKSIIDVQRKVFLINTENLLVQQKSEINKFEALIESDKEIISKREEIVKTAKDQLDNGLISMLDFINFINAEALARQQLALHEVQLLLSVHNYNTTIGN